MKKSKACDRADQHIGWRVRTARMLRGMSQEKLAEHLDLTFQQVQKYEKGVNRIGAGRLWKLSIILAVPVEWFFEGLNGREPGPAIPGLPTDVLNLALQIEQLPAARREDIRRIVNTFKQPSSQAA